MCMMLAFCSFIGSSGGWLMCLCWSPSASQPDRRPVPRQMGRMLCIQFTDVIDIFAWRMNFELDVWWMMNEVINTHTVESYHIINGIGPGCCATNKQKLIEKKPEVTWSFREIISINRFLVRLVYHIVVPNACRPKNFDRRRKNFHDIRAMHQRRRALHAGITLWQSHAAHTHTHSRRTLPSLLVGDRVHHITWHQHTQYIVWQTCHLTIWFPFRLRPILNDTGHNNTCMHIARGSLCAFFLFGSANNKHQSRNVVYNWSITSLYAVARRELLYSCLRCRIQQSNNTTARSNVLDSSDSIRARRRRRWSRLPSLPDPSTNQIHPPLILQQRFAFHLREPDTQQMFCQRQPHGHNSETSSARANAIILPSIFGCVNFFDRHRHFGSASNKINHVKHTHLPNNQITLYVAVAFCLCKTAPIAAENQLNDQRCTLHALTNI